MEKMYACLTESEEQAKKSLKRDRDREAQKV